VALTPALELIPVEQGAGVKAPGHHFEDSPSGTKVHDGILGTSPREPVAQPQLALLVASCSHGLQDERSGFGCGHGFTRVH